MNISIEETYGYVTMTTSLDAKDYLKDTEMEYLKKLTGKIQRRMKQGKEWKAKATVRASKKGR